MPLTPVDPAESYRQLLSLAPDSKTLAEARRLFFSQGWQLLAGDGQWLWGEYRSREGTVYQPTMRLQPSAAFGCNCKAPRQPCRHSLALLLLFLHPDDRWRTGLPPPPGLQAAAPAGSHDKAAATAARDKRLQLMDEGVEELDKWLRDLVRHGLAGLESQPAAFWQQPAARMTDCKLGAVGRRIRALPALFQQADWPDRLLAELGSLYLFVRAWHRREQLSSEQQLELQQFAGLSLRKEEVLVSGRAVSGHWLVMGLHTGEEDKLVFRRVWLRHESSGQWALLLDFSFGQQGFADHWVCGSAYRGTLCYYPGTLPQRAVVKEMLPSRSVYEELSGFGSLSDCQQAYAAALAANPWLTSFPALLEEVVVLLSPDAGGWLAVDLQKNCLPLLIEDLPAWRVVAVSGYQPVWLFGELTAEGFRPLSVVFEGRLITVT